MNEDELDDNEAAEVTGGVFLNDPSGFVDENDELRKRYGFDPQPSIKSRYEPFEMPNPSVGQGPDAPADYLSSDY